MNHWFASTGSRMLPLVGGFFSLLMLGGCILVNDPGPYWKKGTVDPNLEGGWKKIVEEQPGEDEYLSFEKSGNEYLMKSFRPSTPEDAQKVRVPARTLMVEQYRFLMLNQIDEVIEKVFGSTNGRTLKGSARGALFRYAVDGNRLSIYYLDDEILPKVIENQRIKGRLPSPEEVASRELAMPPVIQLDESSLRFLTNIADQTNYWTRVDRYERVRDLKQAIEASKAYPATRDTPGNTLVRVRQPDLKYFAEDKRELLLRHLEGSPCWRVSEERGEIVCCQREQVNGEWKISLNGFCTRMEPERFQTRTIFRFAKEPGGSFRNQFNRSFYTQAGTLDGEIHLNLRASDQGIESYLAVGQEGLWFEFYEQGNQEARTRTRDALQWLREFLRNVRAAENEIEKNGYAAKEIPSNGIRHGRASLEVRDDPENGVYEIYAWINPGAAGRVYLKVFDANTDKRLSEREITLRSTELTGWSGNSSDLFLYNCQVKIYEGDTNHPYDALFELWFRPDRGGSERRLIETMHRISAWQF